MTVAEVRRRSPSRVRVRKVNRKILSVGNTLIAPMLGLSVLVMLSIVVQAQVHLVRLSTDTFKNKASQHATEVEPDSYAFGSTMVTAFQVGRNVDLGAADIGFATSSDGGTSWTHGFLPGITIFYKNGKFQSATDPTVSFDSRHGVWLIGMIGILPADSSRTKMTSRLSARRVVVVSRSSDGVHWNQPVVIDDSSGFADIDRMACDNNPASPFLGHCYMEWDDGTAKEQIRMSTSNDGGQTWSAAMNVPGALGLSGPPVVASSGMVVAPFLGNGMQFFTSTDGGKTWGGTGTISTQTLHVSAGNLRTLPLPSAQADGAGTVYVAWHDCRFRSGCAANDIVLSTSTDGKTWSSVSRVPIDPITSTVDHFIPGLGVDRSTSGDTAHLGLTYYYYPVANCTMATCKLVVGFVSSRDGGKTWTRSKKITGPMNTGWLANTSKGRMIGDYISTSYVNGKAFAVFAKANKNKGATFDDAMYTTSPGLPENDNGPFFSSAGEQPAPNAKVGSRPRQGPRAVNIPD